MTGDNSDQGTTGPIAPAALASLSAPLLVCRAVRVWFLLSCLGMLLPWLCSCPLGAVTFPTIPHEGIAEMPSTVLIFPTPPLCFQSRGKSNKNSSSAYLGDSRPVVPGQPAVELRTQTPGPGRPPLRGTELRSPHSRHCVAN